MTAEKKRRLKDKFHDGDFVVTMELDPPKGIDLARTMSRLRKLKGHVDAINVADCPMAQVRMSPITLSYLIQRELDIETVFHLTCRDRNLIGLQAELLGAAALGVGNVLALTGDRPERGDHPGATGVFDLDSTGLVRLASTLRQGRTLAGTDIEGSLDVSIGVAASPTSPDIDREIERLAFKVQNGADFVQTQPVFDVEAALTFEQRIRRVLPNTPILYGILPIKSLKSARYMNENVPGISIPNSIMERMENGDAETGIEIAGEIIEALGRHVRGVHIFPLNNTRVALAIAERIEALGLRGEQLREGQDQLGHRAAESGDVIAGR